MRGRDGGRRTVRLTEVDQFLPDGAGVLPHGDSPLEGNALDPLLIEDALWHASPADIAEMRKIVAEMATAVDRGDPTAFVHANPTQMIRMTSLAGASVKEG